MAVFAQEQTSGKGQRQRQWASQKDQNIALSLVLEPYRLDPSKPFLLSMAVANSLAAFSRTYLPEDISIKWPNDMYWRDRKAAGILIENLWQGRSWKFAVAGIGININQTDFGDLSARAVSWKQVTGKTYHPEQLARALCSSIDEGYEVLLADPSSIVLRYNEWLYRRGLPARFRKGSRVFEAVVQEVTDNGQLVLRHGVEERFDVGEIEWVI